VRRDRSIISSESIKQSEFIPHIYILRQFVLGTAGLITAQRYYQSTFIFCLSFALYLFPPQNLFVQRERFTVDSCLLVCFISPSCLFRFDLVTKKNQLTFVSIEFNEQVAGSNIREYISVDLKFNHVSAYQNFR
jgi:hypothetical protein